MGLVRVRGRRRSHQGVEGLDGQGAILSEGEAHQVLSPDHPPLVRLLDLLNDTLPQTRVIDLGEEMRQHQGPAGPHQD